MRLSYIRMVLCSSLGCDNALVLYSDGTLFKPRMWQCACLIFRWYLVQASVVTMRLSYIRMVLCSSLGCDNAFVLYSNGTLFKPRLWQCACLIFGWYFVQASDVTMRLSYIQMVLCSSLGCDNALVLYSDSTLFKPRMWHCFFRILSGFVQSSLDRGEQNKTYKNWMQLAVMFT
jgi:hypothetical protein